MLGALVLEIETGEPLLIEAKATLLATGGCGQVYRTTSNAHINTGDGMAMALRAGVPLMDMEFVQFFPIGHLAPRLRQGLEPLPHLLHQLLDQWRHGVAVDTRPQPLRRVGQAEFLSGQDLASRRLQRLVGLLTGRLQVFGALPNRLPKQHGKQEGRRDRLVIGDPSIGVLESLQHQGQREVLLERAEGPSDIAACQRAARAAR